MSVKKTLYYITDCFYITETTLLGFTCKKKKEASVKNKIVQETCVKFSKMLNICLPANLHLKLHKVYLGFLMFLTILFFEATGCRI